MQVNLKLLFPIFMFFVPVVPILIMAWLFGVPIGVWSEFTRIIGASIGFILGLFTFIIFEPPNLYVTFYKKSKGWRVKWDDIKH